MSLILSLVLYTLSLLPTILATPAFQGGPDSVTQCDALVVTEDRLTVSGVNGTVPDWTLQVMLGVDNTPDQTIPCVGGMCSFLVNYPSGTQIRFCGIYENSQQCTSVLTVGSSLNTSCLSLSSTSINTITDLNSTSSDTETEPETTFPIVISSASVVAPFQSSSSPTTVVIPSTIQPLSTSSLSSRVIPNQVSATQSFEAQPTQSSQPQPQSASKKAQTGAIVGGVVGGVSCLAIFAAGLFCIRRKRQSDRTSDTYEFDVDESGASEVTSKKLTNVNLHWDWVTFNRNNSKIGPVGSGNQINTEPKVAVDLRMHTKDKELQSDFPPEVPVIQVPRSLAIPTTNPTTDSASTPRKRHKRPYTAPGTSTPASVITERPALGRNHTSRRKPVPAYDYNSWNFRKSDSPKEEEEV